MDQLPVELFSQIVNYLPDWRDHFHLAHVASYYYKTVFHLVRSVSLVRIVRTGNCGRIEYLTETTMEKILSKYTNLVELNLYQYLPNPKCFQHLTKLHIFRYFSRYSVGMDYQIDPTKWRQLFEFLLMCPLRLLRLDSINRFHDTLMALPRPLLHVTRFDSDIQLKHLDTLATIMPNLRHLEFNLSYIVYDRSNRGTMATYFNQLRHKLTQFKHLRSLTLNSPPIQSCEQLPDLSELKLTRLTLKLRCSSARDEFITLRGIKSIPVTELLLYSYNHETCELVYLQGHPTLRRLQIQNYLVRSPQMIRQYRDDPQLQKTHVYDSAAHDLEPIRDDKFMIKYRGPEFMSKYLGPKFAKRHYNPPNCSVHDLYQKLTS